MDRGRSPAPQGARKLARWLWLPAMVLFCGALSYALSAALFFVADVEHVVQLVNPTDRAISIRVDGGAPLVVGARSAHLLRAVRTGLHEIAIEDGTPRLESFVVTGGRSPMEGYRGVFALADTQWVIVRRDGSGMDAPDRDLVRRFVPPAPGLVAIPRECDSELANVPFHPGLAPVPAPWGLAEQRLCTYEPATRRVGCPICDDASRCTDTDRSGEEPFLLPADPR